MPDVRPCPICLTPGSTASGGANSARSRVTCVRCGAYLLDHDRGTATFLDQLVPHERATLSGLLREHADRHPDEQYPEPLTADVCDRMLHSGQYPLTTDQQIERLLTAIADRAHYADEETQPEPRAVWAARAFVATEPHFDALMKHLGGGAGRNFAFSNPVANGASVRLSLTFAGYQHVEKLRRTTAAGNQAFVAMWFHDDMKPIYDHGILPAINDCGLAPYRVDRDRRNPDRIDAKIVAEIRRSRVVIADVTGERPGVYYEAGLAEGLGIPVIWCCNGSWTPRLPVALHPHSDEAPRCAPSTWEKRLHFDTRQFPHLLWKDATDLREVLTDTLRARGIARPR